MSRDVTENKKNDKRRTFSMGEHPYGKSLETGAGRRGKSQPSLMLKGTKRGESKLAKLTTRKHRIKREPRYEIPEQLF